MKPVKYLIVLVLLVSFLNRSKAQEKYSTVKIYTVADKTQRADLIGLLQVDHFQETEDGAIITEISAADIDILKKTHNRFEILVDDVAGRLRELNRAYYLEKDHISEQNRLAFEQSGKTVGSIIATPPSFEVKPTFGGYYSFAEMEAAMDNLVAAYPSIAEKTSLGKSHENRDIWCIKISDNVSEDELNEPEVLYIGLQHAREAIGGSSMIFLMQYLCEGYATDIRIKELVDNREIFIIPCMNPDGWEYNRISTGAGGGWRKNRRNNGSSFGVDLNRNWGIDWGNCSAPISGNPGSCGSSNPSQDTYYGPYAFSEPETQAIRDFTYAHHLVAMIDQHAYGPYYSLPFGRPSLPANTMSGSDAAFYTYLSASMGNYNGMRAGNSPQSVGYEVAGGVKDWMLKGNIGTGSKGKIYGLTGEGGSGGGTGGSYGSFWAPASQIINLCKGMTYQNLQLLFVAGSYVNLQDQSDINLNTLTGTFDFHITRVGLENQPVTITAIPIENIQSAGSPVTVTTLTNYNDTYSGSVSYTLPAALPDGQRIRFAWKIETGGYSYYDTVTKFYNATQLLYDDMEGNFSTNWNSVAVNANPSIEDEDWSFTSLDKYAGSKSMTESASGDYFQNSTRTVTYNNSFDLSDATAAYLSFWTKHRAENFRDKLRIQVSADGSNWTSVAGTTTVQEPGTLDGSTINGIPSLTGIKTEWTRELFDLSPWLGTATLYLRFQFTSGNGSSFAFSEDDGFYIDNLKVIKSNVALIVLPVHFINFTATLQADQSVRLDWEATVDDQHDYFEIERSPDGVSFQSLGRESSTAPFKKTDQSPLTGNNYYRVKQVDKDGTITYSHIVKIYLNPGNSLVRVFPNPVTDVLNIKISSPGPDDYTIQITDLAGRKIYERRLVSDRSDKIISISLRQEASQVYILMIRNKRNELISTLKLFKQ